MRLRGPMNAVVTGIYAVLLAALLVVAVDSTGGWRRVPPVTPAEQTPVPSATAGLDWRGWRIRTAADVLQLVLIVALGLTPLGARFVHLVAPRGDTAHAAAAWLLILAAVAAVAGLPVWAAAAGLPMWWWQSRMRPTRPELFRPRRGPDQLAWAAAVATGLLSLVLWVFQLILDIRGKSGAYPDVFTAAVVTAWLLVLMRLMLILRLPQSDRLSDLVSSLPGGPRVRVVSGWPSVVATMGVFSLPRRPVILVAPPVAAALTDRELRALMAHEVAHVRHHDTRRRVLRRLLAFFSALAAVVALSAIPALRMLAGLHGRRLSVQAGPFLLALYYLVVRVLCAVELRATRAEERAADRDMLSLSGDPDACTEGLAKLSSLLGIPDAWTLPQRLLFASHPATSERLRLLRDLAPVTDAPVTDAPVTDAPITDAPVTGLPVRGARPRSATAGRVRRGLLAGALVFAALVAAGELSGHRAIAMPADAGKYRVLLPRSVDGSSLDGTSKDAVQLRSSVWGSGDLGRFPGAVPVTAVYDQQGQSWLYVWGAYGKLADPSGELSAFWNKFDALPFGLTGTGDPEPAGPRGGYLQCEDDTSTCAWADNSGIVVVSLSPPGPQSGVIVYFGAPITEQQLAAMTLSLRAAAEVLAHR
jgi:Zn-dependent protease with chaperone function